MTNRQKTEALHGRYGNDQGQMVLPMATKEELMALPEFRYVTEEKEKTEPKAPAE